MSQTLLFPDPRPLVERLGAEFFRQVPQVPGVYLMRDASDSVLYVGKAKNLRKRLGSYRVANPDRLRRRHLRLLRAVARIELQECLDEASALARESELLRALRPRFNRAGTWPGLPRFLAWRVTEEGLCLAVTSGIEPGWAWRGPLGAGAIQLQGALVRLLWCALHPRRGLAGLPAGWFQGRLPSIIAIPRYGTKVGEIEIAVERLQAMSDGRTEEFANWIRERAADQRTLFETAVREADLETLLNS